jgi:cbb3-type cytochrome oxidase maturation protein
MIFVVFLISVSLSIALIFLGVFFWNLKTGQYDDIYTPSIRILFDDKVTKKEKSRS